MLFYLILIFFKLIYFTNEAVEILIDKIFKVPDNNILSFYYCKEYNISSFNYQGRPTDIKEILNSENKNDLSEYKYVSIKELEYLEKVVLFPKSTIFFIYEKIIENKSKLNKDYCYFNITWNLEEYSPLYYISIGKKVDEKTESFIIESLILFFFVPNFFLVIIGIKICRLKLYEQLFIFKFALITLASINLLTLSSIFIFSSISSLLYSLVKSYIFINLILFVDGYTILYFDNRNNYSYRKFFLLILIYESLSNLFLLYIIYFIPSINNYYMLIVKNLIEHIVLLLYTIKFFKEKFKPLYSQYKFEQNLRNVLAISYKEKLKIYGKVLVFSLIYSIAFIILSFVDIMISMGDFARSFYYCIYSNVVLELFLCLIMSILFFPIKVNRFYFLPIIEDYNNKRILVEIDKKNDKSNNISKLTKNLLKNEYIKDDLPLVFMRPFANNKEILYKDLILGTTEKNNNE